MTKSKFRIEYKSFGLKTIDGTLAIVVAPINIEVKDGEDAYKILTKLHFTCGRFGKFRYSNPITNNYIYEEITDTEYYTRRIEQ